MKQFVRSVLYDGKEYFVNLYENFRIKRGKRFELAKIKQPCRVFISESVQQLTIHQKEEIDKLYLKNYGEKIPYDWHQHYMAYTGSFDVNYFPEMLYKAEFEPFMTMNREYATVLSDKNALPIFARGCGVKMPKTYVSSTASMLRDEENRFITREKAIDILSDVGEVFIKPTVDSSSGLGCFIAKFENGIDVLTKRPLAEILKELGNNFAVQERVHCHSSLKNIYPNAVNTFRIITYRWREKICIMPSALRIAWGGELFG